VPAPPTAQFQTEVTRHNPANSSASIYSASRSNWGMARAKSRWHAGRVAISEGGSRWTMGFGEIQASFDQKGQAV